MRVWINGQAVDLIQGMTVRHALNQAGLWQEIEKGAVVLDELGNEVGTEGAVEEEMHLILKYP
jgi:UPF0288 family protein (methanogenesis marker protein 3)